MENFLEWEKIVLEKLKINEDYVDARKYLVGFQEIGVDNKECLNDLDEEIYNDLIEIYNNNSFKVPPLKKRLIMKLFNVETGFRVEDINCNKGVHIQKQAAIDSK